MRIGLADQTSGVTSRRHRPKQISVQLQPERRPVGATTHVTQQCENVDRLQRVKRKRILSHLFSMAVDEDRRFRCKSQMFAGQAKGFKV